MSKKESGHILELRKDLLDLTVDISRFGAPADIVNYLDMVYGLMYDWSKQVLCDDYVKRTIGNIQFFLPQNKLEEFDKAVDLLNATEEKASYLIMEDILNKFGIYSVSIKSEEI